MVVFGALIKLSKEDCMLTRSGMKAKYERLYANGIMYLAKGEEKIAIKYFEGAAMQLSEYVQGLCDEEQDEMKSWLLEMVAHVRELEKYAKETTAASAVKSGTGTSFAFRSTELADVNFSDVVGLEDVKSEIYDKVIYPMTYRTLYERFNKKLGGGILLYGPPGNGKTMIAKAVAKETGSTFFPIKFSDIGSKWFGETEGKIKALFDEAGAEKSAVIFFDEIDAIASARGDDATTNRMVAELLSQMDGINRARGNITIIAATNRIDNLDPAILRPGRFDEKILVPLPDERMRSEMLRKKLSGIPCSKIAYTEIARICEGFSGAEIELVCEKAKQSVIRAIIGGAPNDTKICENDLREAVKSIRNQNEKENRK